MKGCHHFFLEEILIIVFSNKFLNFSSGLCWLFLCVFSVFAFVFVFVFVPSKNEN